MHRTIPLACLLACAPLADDPADTDSPDAVWAGVVPVGPSGPYGSHSFEVEAQTNWVNTGLYLRAGETAELTVAGQWSLDGAELGPEGDFELGSERGCPLGSFVARLGLRFEESLHCIGAGGTLTAETDDIVYVGMILSTDLGETYASRLAAAGEVTVTVTSDGDTVPTVEASDLADYDLASVASGWVEVAGQHNVVTLRASQALADAQTAAASLRTLDDIYTVEHAIRDLEPYSGQRVRWVPDPTITDFAYMLAGNPTRCAPGLMNGEPNQRILRASEPATDIWGFAHELGHSFTLANGAWVYMYLNLESWPNVFTLRALRDLGRDEGQPNAASYCDGREAYLAGGPYADLRDDPFLQLCFLMEFEETYGDAFYENFFSGLNDQTNDDVGYDGSDASVWRYVRERFDLAAGEDTSDLFEAWRVPL